ncbi:MAG: hypothetical protein P8J55_11055 [Pseudomonadales bacterium]|nr:hypothetical protein [Pseudomonadales bacterium]
MKTKATIIETSIAPGDLAQLCNSIAAEMRSQGRLDINVLEIVAFEVTK